MGENLISGGDVVLQSTKLDDLEDVIAYGANANSFLVFNGEKWVAKTLSEVAELVIGDIESVKFNENQFIMDDAGLVNLLGYAEAEIGSQPVKNADGTIGWVKPKEISTEGLATVEQLNNLQELVEGNAKDIDDLQTANNNFNEIINGKADANEVNEALNLKANIADVNNALEGKANVSDLEGKANISDLEGKANVSDLEDKANVSDVNAALELKANAADVNAALELKANAADVYSKTAADKAIADAIAAAPHLERKIYEKLSDAEVAVATFDDSADKYIYMVARENSNDSNYYDEYMAFKDPNGLWQLEKVGDWGVDLSAYAKTSDVNAALENKVDKANDARLITFIEADKLERIEAGAQVNYISAASTDFTVVDGTLSLNNIDISKVSNLESALAEKVNKVYYTVENEDGSTSKVEGTLLSPEDKEKLAALVIDENGSVGVSGTVNAENVEGLGSWITANGATHISNLTESNLFSTLVDKINYITSVDKEVFEVAEGNLQLLSSVKSNLNSLDSILTANAGNENALYLTTTEEKAALSAVVAGDFSNYISSVNEDVFEVAEGKLDLVNVPASALSAVIGNMNLLPNYSEEKQITIVDEINNIYNILTWNDIPGSKEN